MRSLVFFFSASLSCSLWAQPLNELPKNLSKEIRKSVQTSAEELLVVPDCPLLIQVYDPKDIHVTPLGLCFHTHEEVRGIFKQVACVGVLVEPVSGVKNPFYGSKGHWGVEKACDKDRLLAKLQEKATDTTLNPITDLRMKLKEGRKIRLLRDELGVWPVLQERVKPK